MKTSVLICIIVAAAFTMQQAAAQNYIVIEDFEDPDGITIPTNNMTDGNVSNEDAFEVVDNPDPGEVNPTAKVLQYTRAYDGNIWGGFWSPVFEPLGMDEMKYTHYQVWKPRISPVKFKVEGSDQAGNFEHLSIEEQTVTDGWENMSFHFPEAAGDYPVIAIMPDFADPVNLEENIVIYLDNIILSDSEVFPILVGAEQDELPVQLALRQNYPNPFNPATNITFELNSARQVTLNVFDIQGKLVATLVDGHYGIGEHQVTFNASGLPSGMYFYRLQASDWSITRAMTLIK